MTLIKNLTKDSNPSLISGSVVIVGDINNGDNIEIEGSIEGNIFANIITIRESGKVKGNIKCSVLNIKGNFDGNAFCEKINMSDTAVVKGVLEYKFLAVDYGANINCELKRIAEGKVSDAKNIQKQPETK